MEAATRRLERLLAGERVQNLDYELGHHLQQFHGFLQASEKSPDECENLLISLITVQKSNYSKMNAYTLGMCIVSFYQKKKNPSYWNLLSTLTDEVKKVSVNAIVILGVVSRYLGDQFKSQLSLPISVLLQTTRNGREICQTFRRILKGTGDFLINVIPDIFEYVFRGASSLDTNLKIEALKTIPSLLINAKIPMKRLIPIVGQNLGESDPVLRYAAAKAFAKLIKKTPENENFSSELQLFFKMVLRYLKSDANVETLCFAFRLYFRYQVPMQLVKKMRMVAKVALACADLKITMKSMSLLAFSLFDAIVGVCGSTAGFTLTRQFMDLLNKEKEMTTGKACVALVVMSHFDASQKTLAIAGKKFYPMITADLKLLRKYSIAFYRRLATKDKTLGAIFLNTFISFLIDISDDKPLEIEWFSRVTSMMIVSMDVEDSVLVKLVDLAVKWIQESVNVAASKFACAFLLLAAVVRKNEKLLTVDVINKVGVKLQTTIKAVAQLKSTSVVPWMKYVSLFLYQVIRCNNHSFDPIMVPFLILMIVKIDMISSPTLLTFWKSVVATRQIWENDARIPLAMGMNSVSILGKYYNAKKEEVNLGSLLYRANRPLCESVFRIFLELENKERIRDALCDEILKDFPGWAILTADDKRTDLLYPLFSPTPNFVFLKSLTTKRSTRAFLRMEAINGLWKVHETTNNLETLHNIASVIAGWMHIFPECSDTFLQQLEEPNKNREFVGYVIDEYAKLATEGSPGLLQCFAILQRILFTSESPACVKALVSLYPKMGHDFDPQFCLLCEHLCYSNTVLDMDVLYSLCPILANMQSTEIQRCLMHFPINKNFAVLSGLKLGSDGCLSYRDLEKPIAVLVEAYSTECEMNDVSSMFMVLQQSNDDRIAERITAVFDANNNPKEWTEFCKRIIIIGCTPPAERDGDLRIVPNSKLTMLAFEIAKKLIRVVRYSSSLNLNLKHVDDIVSIAFHGIQGTDSKAYPVCFDILGDVISEFSDIRNRDGALLDIYVSQFHPGLKHALENNALCDVAGFCLNYVEFLAENKSPLFDEAVDMIQTSLAKEESAVVYLRIATKLHAIIGKFADDARFARDSEWFIDSVCQQTCSLYDMKGQLAEFFDAILSIRGRTMPDRIILLLLLKQFEQDPNVKLLQVIVRFFKNLKVGDSEISYVLALVMNMKLDEENEVLEIEEIIDDNELESTTFSVVPRRQSEAVFQFLIIASKIVAETSTNVDLWKALLQSSLYPEVCYPAIGYLFTCKVAQPEAALPVIARIIDSSDSRSALAAINIIISRSSLDLCDQLIPLIIDNVNAAVEVRMNILVVCLKRFGRYMPVNMAKIVEFVSASFIPNGINAIVSLLMSNESAPLGLCILKMGVADVLMGTLQKEVKQFPRILHFLIVVTQACERLMSPVELRALQIEITRIALFCVKVVGSVKERLPVLGPACLVLRRIPKDIIRECWSCDKHKELIKKAIEPPVAPKRAQTIQLMSFAPISARRSPSSRGKWQDLEIEDD